MDKWAHLDRFPVKVQVPLLMTVYALLSFKKFFLLDTAAARKPPEWFQVPPDYSVRSSSQGAIPLPLPLHHIADTLPSRPPWQVMTMEDALAEMAHDEEERMMHGGGDYWEHQHQPPKNAAGLEDEQGGLAALLRGYEATGGSNAPPLPGDSPSPR
jgi:hypothetical protein